MDGGTARPGVRRWRTLEHGGMLFPPKYAPRKGLRVGWRGAWIALPPLAEEYASAIARVAPSKRSGRFDANFWSDWSATLPKGCPITSLAGCDFSRFASALAKKKKATKKQRDEAAARRKEHGVAIVDGAPQPMVGYVAEPPGVFMGRGPEHPLAGRIKRRLTPQDVTINIGRGAKAPPPPPGEGGWGAVVHDPFVDWLCAWRDPLTKSVKYARLAPASKLEQGVDRDKHERARKLYSALPDILRRNRTMLTSPDPQQRQLATCLHLLERLALRVGTAGEGARARGLTTLQVRHVRHVRHEARGKAATFRFDFLGKDSVPYVRTVHVQDAAVGDNLASLLRGRKDGDRLFDAVTPSKLNAHLAALHPDAFTAKELRTCRATAMFEEALERCDRAGVVDPRTALLVAGARVALLCNHRKGTPPYEDDDAIHQAIEALPASRQQVQQQVRDLIRRASLALATSRTNYVDPRVPLAHCLRHRMPMPAAAAAAFGGNGKQGGGRGAKFAWAVAELEKKSTFVWRSKAMGDGRTKVA
jgi:DNA topoisomerase-1